MTRTLITIALVVLAIAAAPMPTNPFDGTDASVEPEGTLNIAYSGTDNSITITDRGEGQWTVDIVNGGATWEVPEEAEGFLHLEDSQLNEWVTDIEES